MIGLGFWQLQRLHDRRARNAQVTERYNGPPRPLSDVFPARSTFADAHAPSWSPVRVEGRYDPANEVRIRNRSQDGIPGEHIVTPLIQADGTAVLVNRGFLPSNRGEEVIPPPPTDDVVVE